MAEKATKKDLKTVIFPLNFSVRQQQQQQQQQQQCDISFDQHAFCRRRSTSNVGVGISFIVDSDKNSINQRLVCRYMVIDGNIFTESIWIIDNSGIQVMSICHVIRLSVIQVILCNN